MPMTIEELDNKLRQAYSAQTAHKNYQANWSKDNPTYGHCMITAMIVQDFFGGDIYRIKHEHHNYNVVNGEIIDLTKEQYLPNIPNYSKAFKINRTKEKDTIRRYQILKEKVIESI